MAETIAVCSLSLVALGGCYSGHDGNDAAGDGTDGAGEGDDDDDDAGDDAGDDGIEAGCEDASVHPLRRRSEVQYRNDALFAAAADGSRLTDEHHYVIGMPTVIAGGAGGCLQTGKYVDYTTLGGNYADAGLLPWGVLIPGLPHNRLLVTLMQAMGLAPSDYESDGYAGYGHRERFSGPYNLGDDAYDFNAFGQPLPGIFLG